MATYFCRIFPISVRVVRGFSLIELMVVLCIVSIFLLIAVPSFGGMLKEQRVATTTNDFFMAINLTRSEAIRRGTRVDLVPADGDDWRSGWNVFVDENNDQLVNSGEEIIFSHDAAPQEVTIKSSFTDSATIYLAYNGTGRTRTNSSSQTPQLGTISFISGDRIRRIKLNFVGRPRACNPENDRACTGPAGHQ